VPRDAKPQRLSSDSSLSNAVRKLQKLNPLPSRTSASRTISSTAVPMERIADVDASPLAVTAGTPTPNNFVGTCLSEGRVILHPHPNMEMVSSSAVLLLSILLMLQRVAGDSTGCAAKEILPRLPSGPDRSPW
jgi:hypothetical protein